MTQIELKVYYQATSALKANDRNPRTHSKKQIRQIADSIRQFGFTNPVLIDADGNVIAGHGRIAAAELLGIECVPTICLDHMSEAEKRVYMLADNKLAALAGWDSRLLALELRYLTKIDLDFDLTITGFETAEIDFLVGDVGIAESDEANDRVPNVDLTAAPISRLGDLWLLGPHRLLCGDARQVETFRQLMCGHAAQMVFTDPPYNVRIEGHASGLGRVKHREFAMAAGEMTELEFITFLQIAFGHLAAHSADGSIHFICIDWRHLYEVLTAGRGVYAELKNLCIWNKTNGGMGSLYRSKHELVLVFKHGTAAHINNIELGRNGRYRTNVWDYAGINTLGAERAEELAMHPTVKPVALVADAILDCSRRGGIVLDGFAGSGTTLIAAERTRRRAFAMEIDPHYVDTAVCRWQQYTGASAVLSGTKLTFAKVATARCAERLPTPDSAPFVGGEVVDGQ